MKTILITSQKGGSGKTTLAAHLAVEADRCAGAAAFLIDTDKQATLSLWHGRREADTPARLDVPFVRLADGLKTLAKQKAGYCFVDSAPTISTQTEALIALADLVLIPVRPSPADLWSVAETVALVKAAGKPLLFIVTQAKPQATITAQAVAALSQHGRVAQSFIVDRVAYASAMTGGRTAQEINPRGPAAVEIAALWDEVNSCIHENMNAEREAAHG